MAKKASRRVPAVVRQREQFLTRRDDTTLKKRTAFYLSLGYSARAISKKLNIKYGKALRLREDPTVLQKKDRYDQDFLQAAESKFQYLFCDAVDRLQSVVKHAEPEEALKAIKLIFEAQERLGQQGGRGMSQAQAEAQMAAMMQAGGGMYGQFALPPDKLSEAMSALAKSRDPEGGL